MSDLADRHASPDRTVRPLSEQEVSDLMPEVPGWDLENGRLSRDVRLQDFKQAMAVVNEIGAIAESENHHPDITIHRWNRVRIELYTHSVEGLSLNDFILAAKITQVFAAAAPGQTG